MLVGGGAAIRIRVPWLPAESSTAHTPPGPAGLFAIEILAQCPGGAWRTLSEWEAIFRDQGMALVSNALVGCNMALMVWQPEPADQ
jgi:hypothetical protein